MKKDSFYFSHDYNSKTDSKILMMRMHLSMEGYGIYWFLIETLAENGGKLPIEILPMLSKQMCVEEVKTIAVVTKYGLFEIDDNHFFSIRLNKHLLERKALSEAGKFGNLKRWGNLKENTLLSPPDSPPLSQERKGKEIKGKEKKENNTVAKETFAELKIIFLDEYRKKTESEYYWTAKDAVNLNKLIQKILFKIKEKEKKYAQKEKENYHTDIVEGFKLFISSTKDKWILSQFSIPIFNMKFNEIFTQILTNNGKTTINEYTIRTAMEKEFPK